MNTLTKVLIGAGAVVAAYQGWKIITKPKDESKSNASGPAAKAGLKEGVLKYNEGIGKVFKLKVDGFDSKWILLAPQQQPKPMDWYKLNGKWFWSKWNGKLDGVPHNFTVKL